MRGYPGPVQITIDSEPDAVWKLIAGAASWPNLMPHIQSLQICSTTGRGQIARVTALRHQVPVTSRCLLAVIDEGRCFRVFYLDGIASGLAETWQVTGDGNGRVTLGCSIDEWSKRWNPLRRFARRWMVEPLAGRMLDMICLLAEADYLAHLDVDTGDGPTTASSQVADNNVG